MTPPHSLFLTLLRPCVLQILQAAGFHVAKCSVIDALTDMAARYIYALCQHTAMYAAHNNPDSTTPTITDVRLAMQHMGAFLLETPEKEQLATGIEDLRGVNDFILWAQGPLNKEIKRIALDGEEDATDYLRALKKRYSKIDDDSRFTGTLIGRPLEQGEVLLEGGPFVNLEMWAEQRRLMTEASPRSQSPDINGLNSSPMTMDGDTPGDLAFHRDGETGLP